MAKKKPELLSDIAFAEMLNTRFCHDMAGPVSAVNNGIEYLLEVEDNPEMKQQAIDLICLSAKEGLVKLQTYRMAYGRVAGGGESSTEELKKIMQQFFEHAKITLDWPDGKKDGFGKSLSNDERRLLVNMIVTVAGLLVYGGTLSVRKEISEKTKRGNHVRLLITGKSDRFKHDEELEKILAGDTNVGLTPHNVPLFLLVKLAGALNLGLSLDMNDHMIQLSAQSN